MSTAEEEQGHRSAAAVADDEVVPPPPTSALDQQNKRILELAEQHARDIVANRLYELSSQREKALLEQGKYYPAALLEDDAAKKAPAENATEDPAIQQQVRRLEQLKAELLTAKTADSVDKVRMSRVPKPEIIQDRTSATDFLDRWLSGEVDLPKTQGFEAQLQQRKSALEAPSSSEAPAEKQTSVEASLAAFLEGQ